MSANETTNINNYFSESSKVIKSIIDHEKEIFQIVSGMKNAFNSNNKILIAGNGGSCADAEHFAGELVCTYKSADRKGLPAISLSNNASALTAWGNDFGFEGHFERQIESLGEPNDILFLISTGGGNLDKGYSLNLVRAAKKAKESNLRVYSLIGKTGGELEKISDHYIKIKSAITSHIQEAHIAVLHFICECLEDIKMKD